MRHIVAAFVLLLLIRPVAFGQTAAPDPDAAENVSLQPPASQLQETPRTILALYDGRFVEEIAFTLAHTLGEMPLNHLGLIVRYHDANSGLPPVEELDGVRGVLAWPTYDGLGDTEAFVQWASAVMDSGRRVVIIGDLPANEDPLAERIPMEFLNQFWQRLGLRNVDRWHPVTYNWRIVVNDPSVMEFERSLSGVLPPFPQIERNDPDLRVHLALRRANDPETDTVLVATGPTGGYIADDYTHFEDPESLRDKWYVNPFEFFRLAFGTDDFPKPDTTTVSGRRIFYSHIDGDGFRNWSEFEKIGRIRKLAAEVIVSDVLDAFPDLPVTVAPVVADLDPSWYGDGLTLQIARQIFERPHVEAGSHTYSHPLDWTFLEPYAETGWRPERSLNRVLDRLRETFGLRPRVNEAPRVTEDGDPIYDEGPISYERLGFDLQREIKGSVDFLNNLMPLGKRVEIFQWSGNTMPFEEALRQVEALGIPNLNGGDSRFDPEYPSYSSVSPLSRTVGDHRQIYASNSNENTYTNLWTDRFYGFRHLKATLDNTESPIRVKPYNVYYHFYSGEKVASLDAVIQNLEYARQSELAPITTSNYARIVSGFFDARLTRIEGPDPVLETSDPAGDGTAAEGGTEIWRIQDRGALETLRFDRAMGRTIDFENSTGVLGQRLYQGSLYVALDAAVEPAIVALRIPPPSLPTQEDPGAADTPAETPEDDTVQRAHLVHGSWQVSDLIFEDSGFQFRTHGFGNGEMVWRVRPNTLFRIDTAAADGSGRQLEVQSGGDGELQINLGSNGINPMVVAIQPIPSESAEVAP